MTNENVIYNSINELGWSSLKKIALNANLSVEQTEEAINELQKKGDVLKRNRGRGHQYSVSEEEKKVEIVEEILPEPSTLVFTTIDEFMLTGVKYLPKDEVFDALSISIKLSSIFPNSKWKIDEIMSNLGKLIRMNKLKLRPILRDDTLIYNYVVK